MSDEVRVLLIKPGDVLLIGNAGDLTELNAEVLEAFTHQVGVHVALFEQDIVISSAPAEALTVSKLPDVPLTDEYHLAGVYCGERAHCTEPYEGALPGTPYARAATP